MRTRQDPGFGQPDQRGTVPHHRGIEFGFGQPPVFHAIRKPIEPARQVLAPWAVALDALHQCGEQHLADAPKCQGLGRAGFGDFGAEHVESGAMGAGLAPVGITDHAGQDVRLALEFAPQRRVPHQMLDLRKLAEHVREKLRCRARGGRGTHSADGVQRGCVAVRIGLDDRVGKRCVLALAPRVCTVRKACCRQAGTGWSLHVRGFMKKKNRAFRPAPHRR